MGHGLSREALEAENANAVDQAQKSRDRVESC
jgi:hypothetical protein